jgi:DNA-directed RNA polymerase subunit RPC12/RpoP
MKSIANAREQRCARCGSAFLNLEWDERVSDHEAEYLWHCLNCSNEFVTVVASDEKQVSSAAITEPFFTSLLVE